MSRSRVKAELFYLSVGFSLCCLLLIWYLIVKMRRIESRYTSTASESEPAGQSSYQSSSCVQVTSKLQVPTLEKESRLQASAADKKIEDLRAAEQKQKLVDRIPVESVSTAVQTDHECPQKVPHLEMEDILKQELELQRQRNNILEEEVNGIKEDLIKMKAARSRQHSQVAQPAQRVDESDYLNLKNELQFCQMKLAQSYLSEQQLKSKLDKYERSSAYLINHPEYQRLRQLNNRYKDMIISLQKHLLAPHLPLPLPDDLSFHDL